MNTLVVNLFGGPGVSKSTNTALVFGKLKLAGINAEIASEFAKDLVWEGRSKALNFQPYIIAKQMWRVHRLLGQVEVVLTDSPILFGLIYGKDNHPDWERWIIDTFKSWNTLNFRLVRDLAHHPYNGKGRTQTVDEAQEVDDKIEDMLIQEAIVLHTVIPVQAGEATANVLAAKIMERLRDG